LRVKNTHSLRSRYRIKTTPGEIRGTYQSDEGGDRSRVSCEFLLQLNPPVVSEAGDVLFSDGDGRCAFTLKDDLRR
jgi:hypothetical protein